MALSPRVPAGPVRGAPERYFASPLELDGELIGLFMVTGATPEEGQHRGRVGRLGPLLETITLSVERLRMLVALDRRADDISALRQQLDAFAVDFRSMYQAERDRSQQLAGALGELERTYRATVAGLAIAVEAKDECTGGHLFRVSRYGMLLTEIVSPEHAGDPQFEFGFLLHDVGKLMVPDEVLNKPGALTDAEWEVMRAHPGNGRSILEGIDFLEGAREIVYSHHERWDGQGYPQGLREMEIPLGARIFPLCDAFDAMTSDRPYRRALTLHKALDEVCNGDGTQFWSEAVDAFMSIPSRCAPERNPRKEARPVMSPKRPVEVRLAIAALAFLVAVVAVLGTWQVLAARSSQRSEIEAGEVSAAHLASSALASALASRLDLLSNLAGNVSLSSIFTKEKAAEQAKIALRCT